MAPLWPTSQFVRSNFGGIFDFDAKSERLRTVNASLEDPKVWDDPKKAQELGREKKLLDGVVVTLTRLTQELADNTELFEMSKDDGDDEGLATIEADTKSLVSTIEDLEFRRMFSQRRIRAMPSSISKQARAAPKPVTGPACCCASI